MPFVSLQLHHFTVSLWTILHCYMFFSKQCFPCCWPYKNTSYVCTCLHVACLHFLQLRTSRDLNLSGRTCTFIEIWETHQKHIFMGQENMTTNTELESCWTGIVGKTYRHRVGRHCNDHGKTTNASNWWAFTFCTRDMRTTTSRKCTEQLRSTSPTAKIAYLRNWMYKCW